MGDPNPLNVGLMKCPSCRENGCLTVKLTYSQVVARNLLREPVGYSIWPRCLVNINMRQFLFDIFNRNSRPLWSVNILTSFVIFILMYSVAKSKSGILTIALYCISTLRHSVEFSDRISSLKLANHWAAFNWKPRPDLGGPGPQASTNSASHQTVSIHFSLMIDAYETTT